MGPRRCHNKEGRFGGNVRVPRQDKAAPERRQVSGPQTHWRQEGPHPGFGGDGVPGGRDRSEAVAVTLGPAPGGGCPRGRRIPATKFRAVKAFMRGR